MLEKLKEQLLNCYNCKELSSFRTKVALPYGTGKNGIMFIGEAPSYKGGNLSGQCIIGLSRTGQLITSILEENKIRIEDCYFTNLCFCASPNNRPLALHEIFHCIGYKQIEIDTINPRLVILLGRKPSQYLSFKPEIETVSIEHPSYILRVNKQDEYRQKLTTILQNYKVKYGI
jgi:uracil-DNA glycosylase family 4